MFVFDHSSKDIESSAIDDISCKQVGEDRKGFRSAPLVRNKGILIGILVEERLQLQQFYAYKIQNDWEIGIFKDSIRDSAVFFTQKSLAINTHTNNFNHNFQAQSLQHQN